MKGEIGRRPTYNLRRDGYETVAEYVAERVAKSPGLHGVFVDWRQDVRVIREFEAHRQPERDEAERVGRYRREHGGVRVEQIEDDLIEWIRQNPEQRRTA